ncbi:hypothetical protein FOCC_FOCC004666 [Frankliniella occidentalis]|uniref:Regulator of chromosome condensation n=1 Tax=Frankliniella occidentalis TaxID=133901 RepID=A0A6J1SKR3_FRAOC|nr:regulator of chromosome condensation [Frankliniella occidentalis]XP_026279127.1 regulator of chromosome condensation [Frankliniella occidentalis]KAE8748655.1 hypothetical protein FOCC_FOCC004666 [Frankliniella occidentalis]
MQNGTSRKRQSIRRSLPPSKSGPKPAKKAKTSLGVPEKRFPKLTSGVILTFGQGDVGQLGLGPDVMEKGRPTLIPKLDNLIDMCAGGMHTICLNKKGEVSSFGCNDEGALGRDTSEEGSETEPGSVSLPGSVVQITAGDSHSAALLEDGRVFAWGSFRDSHGTMGLTLQGGEKKPVELQTGTVVVKIASGADHLVMLTEDGQIHTVGCGEQGQLGRVSERGADRLSRQGMGNLLVPGPVPFKPSKKPEFVDVWTATYGTFAKDKNNQIYVFGLNNYNQLGLKEQKAHFHPSVSASLSMHDWAQISGGQHHTLALTVSGQVYSLGRREYGRLGLGEGADDVAEPTLITTFNDKKVVDISCEGNVSYAVTEDGEVYSWGMGSNMQLGMGDDDTDLWVPTKIKGKALENKSLKAVSAGGQHTVLLASDLSAKPSTSVKPTVTNGKGKEKSDNKGKEKSDSKGNEKSDNKGTEKSDNKGNENSSADTEKETSEIVKEKEQSESEETMETEESSKEETKTEEENMDTTEK